MELAGGNKTAVSKHTVTNVQHIKTEGRLARVSQGQSESNLRQIQPKNVNKEGIKKGFK